MHDRFNIVPRKESSHSIANSFKPAIIILLYDVDDCTLFKGQLVILVFCIIIYCNNCGEKRTTWEYCLQQLLQFLNVIQIYVVQENQVHDRRELTVSCPLTLTHKLCHVPLPNKINEVTILKPWNLGGLVLLFWDKISLFSLG